MDLVASTKSNVKDSLPSSYVRVFINEELAFKTGVKPHTATPYINLSHEYFLRDWTKSKIDFVVMDSVGGDHDIIIGAVTLELRELFSKNSQTTRYFQPSRCTISQPLLIRLCITITTTDGFLCRVGKGAVDYVSHYFSNPSTSISSLVSFLFPRYSFHVTFVDETSYDAC
jgi:hypothetical protein